MNRDHLLGWPPTLLALDPEPRKPQRTPVKPAVSQADEQFRREMDKKVTSALGAPTIQLAPEPVKPRIIGMPTEVLIHGHVWYHGGRHLQQGEYLQVWILFRVDNEHAFLEHVFTHKVQAEAALRYYRNSDPKGIYNLLERATEPHDNYC